MQEPLVVAVVVGLVAVVFVRFGVVVRADAAGAGTAGARTAGTGVAATGVAATDVAATGGPAVSIPIVWGLVSHVALFSWLRPL